MWRWNCPGSTIIWEHHSFESALENIALHVLVGSPVHGIAPCTKIHTPVDDGKPCYVEDCTFVYSRLGDAK